MNMQAASADEGLDIAIVRVVAARPGEASIRAVMEACKPALVPATV